MWLLPWEKIYGDCYFMAKRKDLHCAFLPAFPAPGWESFAAVPETAGALESALQAAGKHKQRSVALETEARRLDGEGTEDQAASLLHRALLLVQTAFPDLKQDVTPTQHCRRNKAFLNVVSFQACLALKRGQIAQGERLLNVLNFASSPQAQLQVGSLTTIHRKAALL